VAFVTGGLWAAAAVHFGEHVLVTPFLVFLALGVVVSVTDLSHRVIPRKLLYGGLALIVPLQVIVSAVDGTWHALLHAVIGGAAAYALLFLIWFFAPFFFKGNAMGFGDVNLSGVIGLTVGYLGLVHVYLAFLSGFLIGLLFGLVFMAIAGTGRKTYFPFGPSLCAGAVVAIFWGGPLAEHLFHTSS
jgi:leader peptidase (prepilin peptidase)/N-methyltransferase